MSKPSDTWRRDLVIAAKRSPAAENSNVDEESRRVAELMADHSPPFGPWPRRLTAQRFLVSVVNEVRRGQRTPDYAERWAWFTGRRPFAVLTEAHRDALHATLWPLSLAIFWIAWRDPIRVAEACASFAIWGLRIWSNPECPKQLMSFARAERQLWDALGSGNINATGIQKVDFYTNIIAERVSIDSAAWVDAKWHRQDRDSIVLINDRVISTVLVSRDDVKAMFSVKTIENIEIDKEISYSSIEKNLIIKDNQADKLVDKNSVDFSEIRKKDAKRMDAPFPKTVIRRGRPQNTEENHAEYYHLLPAVQKLVDGGMQLTDARKKVAESMPGPATVDSKAKYLERAARPSAQRTKRDEKSSARDENSKDENGREIKEIGPKRIEIPSEGTKNPAEKDEK